MIIFIEAIAQILFSFAIMQSVILVSGQKVTMAFFMILILLVSFATYCRTSIGKLSLFLLSQAAALAVGFGISQATGRYIPYLVLFLVVIGMTTVARLIDGLVNIVRPSYFQLIILFLLYLVMSYIGITEASKGCYLAFAVILILRLIHQNLIQADQFIFNRRGSTKMNVSQLRRMNLTLTGIYAAVMAVVLYGCSRIDVSGFAGWMIGRVRAFLIWFLNLVHGSPVKQNPEVSTELIMPAAQGGMIQEEVVQESALSKIVDHVIGVAGITIGVVAVIGALIAIAIAIYRYFYATRRVDGDETEFLGLFTNKEQVDPPKHDSHIPIFDRNLGKKVRRLYRKEVREHWKNREDSLDYLTPQEQVMQEKRQREQQMDEYQKKQNGEKKQISEYQQTGEYQQNGNYEEQQIGEYQKNENDEEQQIIHIYEKARYSKHEVDKGELSQLKQIFAGRKHGRGRKK